MSVFDSVQLHSRSRLCSRERLHAVHPISRESFFFSFFLLRLKQFLWACLSRLFKADCQPLLLLTPLSFSRQTVNHSLNWLLSPVPGRLSTIALAGSSLLFRADCRPLSLLAALSCPRQTVNHRLYWLLSPVPGRTVNHCLYLLPSSPGGRRCGVLTIAQLPRRRSFMTVPSPVSVSLWRHSLPPVCPGE